MPDDPRAGHVHPEMMAGSAPNPQGADEPTPPSPELERQRGYSAGWHAGFREGKAAATGGLPDEPGADDPVIVGYVVLSDHIDRSTGKHGIDVNWDGELHPTRDAAEESAADADDEAYADASINWLRVGVVTIPTGELPPWWSDEKDERP